MATGTTESDTALVDSVLEFWFGKLDVSHWDAAKSQERLWYGATAEDDDMVRTRFGSAVESALDGGLDRLIGSEIRPGKAEVALTLLLDQFPRHIYRGDARAFAGDARSRGVTYAMLEPSRWARAREELPVVMRMSFLLPLMHQESVADNERCLAEVRALVAECEAGGSEAEEIGKKIGMSVDYSLKHLEIVQRFGRYPHRNAVLGRESTAEEVEFLKDGPRFGQ